MECILLRYPTSCLPFASLDSEHLLCFQGFAIWIIQCAASCWVLLSLVWDGMHQSPNNGIQCVGAVLFHCSLILRIFRGTWSPPHFMNTPVIEWMESRCCCDLKFESNSSIHYNSAAHARVLFILMWPITNHKTLWTRWELVNGWWLRSWCCGMIWIKADIP